MDLTGLLFNKVTLGLAIAAAATYGYMQHRSTLIQTGYGAAMRDVQDREDTRLREQVRETGRLVGLVKGLNDESIALTKQADALRDGWLAAERLYADQESDVQRRIDNASASAVRRYAKAVDGNLERCRQDLARFSGEAITGSIAAHTLKKFLDERPTCKPPEVVTP